MPEEVKPCPACGSHPELGGSVNGSELWVACGNMRKCRMAGPSRKTVAEAVAAWNAMPRALEWTDSRPKVPGWYWFRNGGAKPVILPITLPVRWKVEPDDEWAGPIPEPREPKEQGGYDG